MTARIQAVYARPEEVYYSDWVVVDQAMIDRFADVTHDHQYIHVDPEKAVASPFGGTVAHGLLTLSLLPHLRDLTPALALEEIKTGVNVGFDRVRFVHPVRSGSKVRAQWAPVSIEEKAPGTFQCIDDVTVEIGGVKKPAMVATWITRYIF
ncbi:MAG: MaoC family dehydratase [Sphingobium sp.]